LKSYASATDSQSRGIFVGLGANIDDRLDFLRRAVGLLAELPAVRLIQTSSLYESEPVGYAGQGNFLNMVAEVETTLSPLQFLRETQHIESKLGRVRQKRWGPRTIDIDILCWNRCLVSERNLRIPHAELPHRKFVLVPFAEIAPDFRVPPQLLQVVELLARTADQSMVELLQSANVIVNSR